KGVVSVRPGGSEAVADQGGHPGRHAGPQLIPRPRQAVADSAEDFTRDRQLQDRRPLRDGQPDEVLPHVTNLSLKVITATGAVSPGAAPWLQRPHWKDVDDVGASGDGETGAASGLAAGGGPPLGGSGASDLHDRLGH